MTFGAPCTDHCCACCATRSIGDDSTGSTYPCHVLCKLRRSLSISDRGRVACTEPPASLAILWLATRGEGISPPVAETLDCAAGLSGKQKWGLILPSSARVSRLMYQTVIGVRYPELVRPTSQGWQYGQYVSTGNPTRRLSACVMGCPTISNACG